MNHRNATIRFITAGIGPFIPVIAMLCILPSGTCFAAGSPFELEISDLEKKTVKPPPARENKKRPAPKRSRKTRAATMQPVPVERDGEYLNYTIRPGDHVYKVLTTRFGLSSAKAEQLIPEILRINGIANIAGLQIGQVMLIPAAAVATGKAAGVESGAVAPPPHASASPVTPPVPAVESGLLGWLRDLWLRLFPERGPAAGEIRERTIGNRRYPVVKGADLADIIVAREGALPVFTDMSGARTADAERVVVVPSLDRHGTGALLKAAGFEKVSENASFSFGADPKVAVRADYAITKVLPGTDAREQILVFAGENGCPPPGGALSAFLSSRGFRLVSFCSGMTEKQATAEDTIVPLSAVDHEKLVDSLLDALSLTWRAAYPVEMVLNEKEGYRIGVNVDRYFEDRGERYFVDFGRQDAEHETLMRLVELAGYRRIAVDPTAGVTVTAEKFLQALQHPAKSGKRTLTSTPDGSVTVETSCVMFSSRSSPRRMFLVADPPLDKPVCDLLTAGLWSAR